MKPITILYDDLPSGEKQETVSTLENLKLRVQAIGEKYSSRVGMPFGIDLEAVNGDRLSAALGKDQAALSHFDAKRLVTVTAVGDAGASGNTAFYFGDQTLMPNKFVIPAEIAWRIIDEWCEHGTLSELVTWTSAIR